MEKEHKLTQEKTDPVLTNNSITSMNTFALEHGRI
jgi:hypothetical protein